VEDLYFVSYIPMKYASPKKNYHHAVEFGNKPNQHHCKPRL